MAATFQDWAGSSTDSSSYSFSGLSIGSAASNRAVLALIHGGAQTRTITSVTIGGISATQCASYSFGGGITAIYGAIVPTGTTATVVVNFSGTQDRCGVAVYTTTDLKSFIAFDSGGDADGASPFSAAIDIPTGGFVIAGVGTHNSVSGTWTWGSGMEGDVAQGIEANRYFVAGHGNFDEAESNFTVQVSFSGSSGDHRAFLAASFEPAAAAVAAKVMNYRRRRI